eukprot:CAMPEP_0178989788 /NCGR_PEP_ID=MMETSP0795-20121207/4571_1 /TAXON_ID=88552 /ORGANISM="Amoebophrya sp., Strain Ameob2" /LENGTH=1047 /DNA_ID=CAMNT_0020681233 /DNA_START=67 /DNA_END=3210 /DNA_ORIENTATION=+
MPMPFPCIFTKTRLFAGVLLVLRAACFVHAEVPGMSASLALSVYNTDGGITEPLDPAAVGKPVSNALRDSLASELKVCRPAVRIRKVVLFPDVRALSDEMAAGYSSTSSSGRKASSDFGEDHSEAAGGGKADRQAANGSGDKGTILSAQDTTAGSLAKKESGAQETKTSARSSASAVPGVAPEGSTSEESSTSSSKVEGPTPAGNEHEKAGASDSKSQKNHRAGAVSWTPLGPEGVRKNPDSPREGQRNGRKPADQHVEKNLEKMPSTSSSGRSQSLGRAAASRAIGIGSEGSTSSSPTPSSTHEPPAESDAQAELKAKVRSSFGQRVLSRALSSAAQIVDDADTTTPDEDDSIRAASSLTSSLAQSEAGKSHDDVAEEAQDVLLSQLLALDFGGTSFLQIFSKQAVKKGGHIHNRLSAAGGVVRRLESLMSLGGAGSTFPTRNKYVSRGSGSGGPGRLLDRERRKLSSASDRPMLMQRSQLDSPRKTSRSSIVSEDGSTVAASTDDDEGDPAGPEGNDQQDAGGDDRTEVTIVRSSAPGERESMLAEEVSLMSDNRAGADPTTSLEEGDGGLGFPSASQQPIQIYAVVDLEVLNLDGTEQTTLLLRDALLNLQKSTALGLLDYTFRVAMAETFEGEKSGSLLGFTDMDLTAHSIPDLVPEEYEVCLEEELFWQEKVSHQWKVLLFGIILGMIFITTLTVNYCVFASYADARSQELLASELPPVPFDEVLSSVDGDEWRERAALMDYDFSADEGLFHGGAGGGNRLGLSFLDGFGFGGRDTSEELSEARAGDETPGSSSLFTDSYESSDEEALRRFLEEDDQAEGVEDVFPEEAPAAANEVGHEDNKGGDTSKTTAASTADEASKADKLADDDLYYFTDEDFAAGSDRRPKNLRRAKPTSSAPKRSAAPAAVAAGRIRRSRVVTGDLASNPNALGVAVRMSPSKPLRAQAVRRGEDVEAGGAGMVEQEQTADAFSSSSSSSTMKPPINSNSADERDSTVADGDGSTTAEEGAAAASRPRSSSNEESVAARSSSHEDEKPPEDTRDET